MDIVSIVLIVVGLALFEGVSSIDNAIINAEILSTMGARARRFFITWGIFLAVFLVRGLLPWLIVWAAVPSLGFLGAFSATFSNDPAAGAAIERSAPVLLLGGGIFLLFLFLHWLFLEPKNFGFPGERFFLSKGVWFYTVVSVLLSAIVWFALGEHPMAAFGAVVGSSVFFITHGFRQQAEAMEAHMLEAPKGMGMSDVSKIFYLEVIDLSFSIDGVLGAFAFTFSVPLILIGNGFGAIVVRQLTISNIERVKRYRFLKNGAMYSILALGTIMIAEGFGVHVPVFLAPAVTILAIGYFFVKSVKEAGKSQSRP